MAIMERRLKIKMIAAVDENWGIGFQNRLLFSIPEDMAFFKQKTMGNVVVMGRKTLESFPNQKPLKGRVNVILTSDKGFSLSMEEREDSVHIANSIKEVFLILKKYSEKEIYVIGGGSVYKQFLSFAEEIFLTRIKKTYLADTIFPELSKRTEWKLAECSESRWYEGVEYQFCRYIKEYQKK